VESPSNQRILAKNESTPDNVSIHKISLNLGTSRTFGRKSPNKFEDSDHDDIHSMWSKPPMRTSTIYTDSERTFNDIGQVSEKHILRCQTGTQKTIGKIYSNFAKNHARRASFGTLTAGSDY
jgi:hypothetical protein